MTLIDGDKIVTAQLYNDEYEEFIEEKMSIIDYINAYTDEGVTIADDVLDKIRAEIEQKFDTHGKVSLYNRAIHDVLDVIDKYKADNKETIGLIPYLMHKEMDIPISECQKAYDVAIEYLRSQGRLKG